MLLLLFFVTRQWRSRAASGLLVAIWLGFGWHLLWAAQALQARLPAALEGQDLWVVGQVSSLPESGPRATQFQFFIEHHESASGALPFEQRLVLLNSYQPVALAPGQRWRLKVRLNRPHGFANPGGFDYEAYLLQQGIAAKGYVRDDAGNQLLGIDGYKMQRLRYALRSRLLEMIEELPNLGILLALALGDRSGLSQDQWNLMSATGTNHLFVISGLHIGLVTTAVYWLASLLLRWVPAINLYCPRQKIALIIALVAALGYSLLAGFTLPTQRAFIMTAVFVVGQLGSRALPMSLRLILALALILTLNPLATLNSGFWLSFVAVSALLLWVNVTTQTESSRLQRLFNYWLRPQWVVFVALLPFLVWWTGQVSLLSPLINVVAIPVVGLLVVPLTLLGVLLLMCSQAMAQLVLQAGDSMVGSVMLVLQATTVHSPWSVITFSSFNVVALLCLLLASILMLAPLHQYWRVLVLPLCLPALFPLPESRPPKSADIHIIDVGQGLSVIVKTANHLLIYDTGAQLSPEFDLGTAAVVPVLRTLGETEVDAVVISHFDNDHAGGLSGLLNQLPVSQLLSGNGGLAAQALDHIDLPTQGSALTPRLISRSCRAGQQWQWDGVEFSTLHPLEVTGFDLERDHIAVNGADANNQSCVLQVRVGAHRLLLPGDIERQSELALARRLRQNLQSDILLAPHHGSNTSSTYGFLKQVRPVYVVYTSGYRNSFGHPTDRVRQRYREFGSTEYITHATGMLSFRLTEGTPLQPPLQYRTQHPRYWY